MRLFVSYIYKHWNVKCIVEDYSKFRYPPAGILLNYTVCHKCVLLCIFVGM